MNKGIVDALKLLPLLISVKTPEGYEWAELKIECNGDARPGVKSVSETFAIGYWLCPRQDDDFKVIPEDYDDDGFPRRQWMNPYYPHLDKPVSWLFFIMFHDDQSFSLAIDFLHTWTISYGDDPINFAIQPWEQEIINGNLKPPNI